MSGESKPDGGPMRHLVPALAALALAACTPPAGAAPPGPDKVTYLLGGITSGPYRVEADLRTGEAAEATMPRGVTGADYNADPAKIPVTARRTLPAAELTAIRALAAQIWRDGMRTSG